MLAFLLYSPSVSLRNRYLCSVRILKNYGLRFRMRYSSVLGWRVGLSLIVALFVYSCKDHSSGNMHGDRLFQFMPPEKTGIDFVNQVEYTREYNTYTYRNFYNGAGVGLGDVNNDGYPDIYFCGNLTDNKLYLNRGDFTFEDITDTAGVACHDVWSTGVSMADVNGDGWLDIYVCKSGDPNRSHRHNELFINNGDLTFTEKAKEYGLDDLGLSAHASFFDYDRDGDLDCYLLNNSFQSVTDYDLQPGVRDIRDTLGGNKLYRNDQGHFVDVSEDAGIYGSKIGFGLGVSTGDFNRDGWPDIYVSNDFFERDYLYINQHDGTFREVLEDELREISLGAMGADVADINNDGYPEIFATEMTPEGNTRLKTKALFESWENYQIKLRNGYYRQFARNVLQLNNRNGTFSEIGRYAGVAATDWSWGALIMDLDNDGWKDIFVANGIYKDLLDRDYLELFSNPSIMRSMIRADGNAILNVIDRIPSQRIPNYAFKNNGDLTFSNMAGYWGLDTPSFSNGAAYGDLDNDGDLDLVINNVNMPPFVYRNHTSDTPGHNYLSVKLVGERMNRNAIGAAATLYIRGDSLYLEQYPMRGFKSTVDNRLIFGLGNVTRADSLRVYWPGGGCTVLYDIQTNRQIVLHFTDKQHCLNRKMHPQKKIFSRDSLLKGLDFVHIENDFNDFDRDRLLFMMLSNEGPHVAVSDVDGDGLEDIYFCGAKDETGALYVQTAASGFRKTNTGVFETDKTCEDTDCAFFDADGDGDPDLYVASGGNEFPSSSSALADRLYLNDGAGNFHKSGQLLPAGKFESTACVRPADYDADGDIDLFVGIRLQPFSYGIPVNGYLLENDGHGKFSNITTQAAPGLLGLGMITDMVWADVDNDDDLDMVIAGDWMPVKIFLNRDGKFTDVSERYGLKDTEGWWHRIIAADLNGDGRTDFVLGNHGLNSFFKASPEKPISMWVNDFDLNGKVEQIICMFNGDTSYPVVQRDDLIRQIPLLAKKYPTFDSYKDQAITDMFTPEILKRSVVAEAKLLQSVILMNRGEGKFGLTPLPDEAQFSPVYAILVHDFNRDGYPDILLGGNQYRAKPETGIYDAGYGLYLENMNDGTWESCSGLASGFVVKGEIRDLKLLNINGHLHIIVAKNNDHAELFNFTP